MKPNLKAITSALAAAALLASPAMAKSRAQHHHPVQQYSAPSRMYAPNESYGAYGPNHPYGYMGPSQGTLSDWWRATHSGSWDATHDPRENPSQ